MDNSKSLIISIVNLDKIDNALLVVGEVVGGKTSAPQILNSFHGQKAIDIYNTLITKENNNGNK